MQESLEKKNPFLLAHWHGDEIVLMSLIGRYRIATMVSTSADGELMRWLVHRLGGATSRGSSTRGGASALRGLVRLIREQKFNSSVAVDGPKGPLHKVKPGVFEVSRIAQIPIYWAGVSADRFYCFNKAWNKAILPKPFARVTIHWFGPMHPLEPHRDPKSPELALTLEKALLDAKSDAYKQYS